ncbi:MAG TPA: hypothetical protein VNJ53_04680 [Gaiellaceae bacterium]|nr:hypothetical protein [Gaiellaceae bacterium]
MSEPYALGSGEGRVVDRGDFEVIVKASEQETDALRREDVGESELAAIATAHGVEIVGPSSEQYV